MTFFRIKDLNQLPFIFLKGQTSAANSFVFVKIDDSQLLEGIQALLDSPQIIKDFHSLLHPLTQMIDEHQEKGTFINHVDTNS